MTKHAAQKVAKATSLFFMVRCLVRTKLAQGKRLNPSAWLRVETLKFIGDREKTSMSDIAAYLSITAPSATSLVTGLIKEGLVVRTKDTTDRRAFRLELSREGKSKLAAKIQRGTALLGEVFAVLSEEELNTFIALLEKIEQGGR
jgi:DNA-binding MarR family transcriptional regulator